MCACMQFVQVRTCSNSKVTGSKLQLLYKCIPSKHLFYFDTQQQYARKKVYFLKKRERKKKKRQHKITLIHILNANTFCFIYCSSPLSWTFTFRIFGLLCGVLLWAVPAFPAVFVWTAVAGTLLASSGTFGFLEEAGKGIWKCICTFLGSLFCIWLFCK